ncbi:hypothetical protein E2R25_21915 [Burkholderia pseudomallei]|nr:hypothetical protein EXY28_22125 [Burkholderia pseudomallei]QBP50896.1 hypothetical protein E2R28_21880 [Burkholderia pseudomallei]QBP70812.1 hypothetical protein E2R25_21915 [Burkholderia pseudomallei]QBR26334.1 hypothetical protein E3O37_22210 [Burkholderia pseudomallei]
MMRPGRFDRRCGRRAATPAHRRRSPSRRFTDSLIHRFTDSLIH